MKKTKISSLSLKNFQSLREPATLPISDLTLLFGPNSAGKSSIVDALMLFQQLFARKYAAVDESLKKWAHRSGNGEVLLPELTIDCFLPASKFDIWDLLFYDIPAEYFDVLNDSEYVKQIISSRREVPAKVTVSLLSVDGPKGTDNLVISLSLDGVDSFEINSGLLHVNLNHPALGGWGDRDEILSELRAEGEIDDVDNWYTINDVYFLENSFHTVLGEVRVAVRNFLDTAAGIFFFGTLDVLGETFAPDHVPASRKIPSSTELSFLYSNGVNRGSDLAPILSRFNFTKDLRHFAYIAFSSVPLDASRDFKMGFLRSKAVAEAAYGKSGRWEVYKNEKFSVDRLNGLLSQHLFLDNGYALNPKVFEITASKGIIGYVVNLQLLDSSQRTHEFEDVGSGISYVIPVLTAALASYLSVLEEPELHLHPALQAELGDVFIECAKNGNTLIIETHSEHLILRLLRRIRQGGSKPQIDATLSINASQVSVIYFEPQLGGHTLCRTLRITEAGDFMDRWPRGFFTERDGDLFDE